MIQPTSSGCYYANLMSTDTVCRGFQARFPFAEPLRAAKVAADCAVHGCRKVDDLQQRLVSG